MKFEVFKKCAVIGRLTDCSVYEEREMFPEAATCSCRRRALQQLIGFYLTWAIKPLEGTTSQQQGTTKLQLCQ
jgi:hypothetical protein